MHFLLNCTYTSTRRKRRSVATRTVGATALKPSEDFLAYEDLEVVAELYIPPEKRIGLLALTEHTCKWPIGDPLKKDDFYFCGQDVEADVPYCEFHSRRAYHQVERKRR